MKQKHTPLSFVLDKARMLLALSLLIPFPAFSATQDLLVFIDGNATEYVDGVEEDDVTLAVDFVYSYNRGPFKVLAEYTYSDEENEFERIQFGWQIEDNATIWLGRFHSPDNYWNTTFHHGQYLQTAISRPWIDLFEDENGPLASHISGLLLESTKENANHSGYDLKLAIGAGPHLEPNLEPFEPLNPSVGHDLSLSGRISFLPDISAQNQIGLLFSKSSISVNDRTIASLARRFDRVHQTVLGGYIDWGLASSRVIASVKNTKNELSGLGDDSFWSSYIYVEKRLTKNWQLYARIDHVEGGERSPYLSLLEAELSKQQVLGVRWDFYSRHAITLEIAHKNLDSGNDSNLVLQWSTVFP